MKLTPTQASLLAGASTIFAISPIPTVTHYHRVLISLYQPKASSLDALQSDWVRIGVDIHAVLTKQADVQDTA